MRESLAELGDAARAGGPRALVSALNDRCPDGWPAAVRDTVAAWLRAEAEALYRPSRAQLVAHVAARGLDGAEAAAYIQGWHDATRQIVDEGSEPAENQAA